jgi:ABC-type transport system substrate-binding protein
MRTKLVSVMGALVVLSLVAAQCAPVSVVEVEKVVKETVVVEKEVEVVVTPTPTPLPEKTGQDAVRYQIGISHLSYSSPFHVRFWKSQQFNHLLWEPLVYPGKGNLPELRLATDVQANEDASVWTFTLNEEARWTDGQPVTAEDVAFTYKMVLNPEVLSQQQASIKGIKGAQAFIDGEADDVEGIQVIDDHTVQFELEQPDATFILNTGIPIAPKHVYEQFPVEDIAQGITPEQQKPTVTSGPFKFVTYEEAQFMNVERWDDYWGEPAKVKEVFGVHVDWGTVLAQLEAGEIDFTFVLDPGDAERLEQLPHIDVYRVPSPNYCGLKVNTESLPDKEVRQALAYAIDFEAIAETSHSGFVTPAYSPITGPDPRRPRPCWRRLAGILTGNWS